MTDPNKKFWIIVAIDADHDNAWILDRSSTCNDVDLIHSLSVEDNSIDSQWMIGRGWGLFKLFLFPWYHTSYEGEVDTGIDVIDVDVIHEVLP